MSPLSSRSQVPSSMSPSSVVSEGSFAGCGADARAFAPPLTSAERSALALHRAQAAQAAYDAMVRDDLPVLLAQCREARETGKLFKPPQDRASLDRDYEQCGAVLNIEWGE